MNSNPIKSKTLEFKGSPGFRKRSHENTRKAKKKELFLKRIAYKNFMEGGDFNGKETRKEIGKEKREITLTRIQRPASPA